MHLNIDKIFLWVFRLKLFVELVSGLSPKAIEISGSMWNMKMRSNYLWIYIGRRKIINKGNCWSRLIDGNFWKLWQAFKIFSRISWWVMNRIGKHTRIKWIWRVIWLVRIQCNHLFPLSSKSQPLSKNWIKINWLWTWAHFPALLLLLFMMPKCHIAKLISQNVSCIFCAESRIAICKFASIWNSESTTAC